MCVKRYYTFHFILT